MKQKFSLFINFGGNCAEAAAFYAKVFHSEVKDLMTYDQMPPDPNYPLPEADKKRVAYCCVPFFDCDVMFSDIPSDMKLITGNNISPTLVAGDEGEVRRIFAELAEDGEVGMPMEKTFWSPLYGMATDKYGVMWQVMLGDDNA